MDNGSGSEDDGVFAFARATDDGASYVVVVVNASDEPRVTAAGIQAMELPSSLQTTSKVLRPVLTIGTKKLEETLSFPASDPLRLPVPPSSVVVYEPIQETSPIKD